MIFFIEIAIMNLIHTKISSYVPYFSDDHVIVDSLYYLFCFDIPEFLSLQPIFVIFLWIMLKIYYMPGTVVLFVSHQIRNPNPMRLPQLLYHLLLSLSQKNIFHY